MGLPSIQVILAENQKEAAIALMQLSAVLSLSESGILNGELKVLIIRADKAQLINLSKRSAEICCGNGADIVCGQMSMTND